MKSTKFVRLDGDDEDAVPLTQFRQRPAPYAHTPSYDGPQQSQSWYGGNTGHASQYTYVQNPPGSYSDNTNSEQRMSLPFAVLTMRRIDIYNSSSPQDLATLPHCPSRLKFSDSSVRRALAA